MYHCLNKEELIHFLDYLLNGTAILDDFLEEIISKSEKGEDCIGILNYCFSIIVEQNKNTGSNDMIETVYREIDKRFLEIHEIDRSLIDHMIRTLPLKNLSLEENLIDLQTDTYHYHYGKQIRY